MLVAHPNQGLIIYKINPIIKQIQTTPAILTVAIDLNAARHGLPPLPCGYFVKQRLFQAKITAFPLTRCSSFL